MIEHYLLVKFLHVLGVIIFLGNIIVTAFWKVLADRTKNWTIISYSQRLVTYTDIVFTLTGILLINTTGMIMAKNFPGFLSVNWIKWGLAFFTATGVLWVGLLIPIQIYLHRLTSKHLSTEVIPTQYWTYETAWMIIGSCAVILPLMSLYMMVFKPI